MFYGNFGMFVRALAYILANGPDGLRQTTEDAVLNANYLRAKLESTFDLPYKTRTLHEVVFSDKWQVNPASKPGYTPGVASANGTISPQINAYDQEGQRPDTLQPGPQAQVGSEKEGPRAEGPTHPAATASATNGAKPGGVKTGDMGKRMIDYGFHAYTTSFPLIVPGAMMIEPTESESREELDLLVDALQQIAREAAENPDLVRTAPHTTRLQRLDETTAARKPILRWKAPIAPTPLTPDTPAEEW